MAETGLSQEKKTSSRVLPIAEKKKNSSQEQNIEFDFTQSASFQRYSNSTLRSSPPTEEKSSMKKPKASSPALQRKRNRENSQETELPQEPQVSSEPQDVPETPKPSENFTQGVDEATRPSRSKAEPRETSLFSSKSSFQRASSSSSTRPSQGISDFRKNAERQAREQKAVGNVLAWVGYSLLGGLLLTGVLAGFGGYSLLQMIQSQAMTVAELDARYENKFREIEQQSIQWREATEVQMEGIQALTRKQQEAIKALTAHLEKTTAQLDQTRKELKKETRNRIYSNTQIEKSLNQLNHRVRRAERR